MPIELHWPGIAIRLFCAFVASALVGLNRSERGHAAGLRTSILVCLAACIAMIQVNLLLPTAGRPPNSFVMNDLMRLPLGILSGMGFIGAGAIIRRDALVTGITTAATLWVLTVIGLCFGGGQVALGWVGAGLSMLVLYGLKRIEKGISQTHEGTLVIVTAAAGLRENEIRALLTREGFRITAAGIASSGGAEPSELKCELRWRAKIADTGIPEVIHRLRASPGVIRLEWSPKSPLY